MGSDRIAAFIRKHHVMTLATVGSDGEPWVAHVFYAWIPGEELRGEAGSFVFSTEEGTRHGVEMEANGMVAAGIALETRTVGRLQGLQVEGIVRKAEGVELDAARRAYIKRFPYAIAAVESLRPLPPLWLLEPHRMKLTDNTLGFGKKLIWEKENGGL